MPLLVATLEGDTEVLGRSILSRAKKAVTRTTKAVGHAAAAAGRAVGHGTATTSRPTARAAKKAGKAVGHAAATAGRAVGHAAATASRVSYREAKRLIRAVARPIVAKMLHGDEAALFGAADPVAAGEFLRKKRKAIIAGTTTAATAAVAASVVAAPAAPAVPVLLPPIIDGLIDEVAKKGRAVLTGKDSNPVPLTPDPAPGQIPSSSSSEVSESSEAETVGGLMSKSVAGIPLPVLAAGGLAAFLFLRRKG